MATMFKIRKGELRSLFAAVFIAIAVFYLTEPVKTIINGTLGLQGNTMGQLIVGIALIFIGAKLFDIKVRR